MTFPRRVGTSRVKKNIPTRSVRPRGEWHLWIYCCYWKLKLTDVSITHCESSDRKIEKALSILNGQELNSVSIDRNTKETKFEFDLGGILSTTPYECLDSGGEPYESWMLYLPDGNVVTYRADGKYAHESAQKEIVKLEWIDY